ncbi:MAG: DUF4307 domain-containing protein [Janthinobacterium lividum]
MDSDPLAQRYGRPPGGARPWYRRPVLLGLSVLFALLVIGYGVWVSLAQSSGPSFTEIGHSVVDDSTAEIRFSVTREAGQAVRCTVHALDADSSEVGLLQVDVAASTSDADVQETAEVKTTARAVTVEVVSCALVRA